MFINHKFFNTKYIDNLSRRRSPRRIFLGKGELKHTNSKVIITFYVYNTKNISLKNEYKKLHRSLYPKLKYIKLSRGKINMVFIKNILKRYISLDRTVDISKDIKGNEIINYNRPYTLEEFLESPKYYETKTNIFKSYYNRFSLKQMTFYDIYCSIVIFFINNLTAYLKILVKYYEYLTNLVNIKILNNNEKFFIFINKTSSFYANSYPNYYFYKNIAESKYKENLYRLRYLLTFNNIKFEKPFTVRLIHMIEKLYNKKIEFNIVNLKKMHLNSDILTQAIVIKLKNRKNVFYRVLKSAFYKVKLPESTRISDLGARFNKKSEKIDEYLINKIRNIYFSEMLQGTTEGDIFNKLLFNLLPLAKDLKVKTNLSNKDTIFLQNYVLRHLKHFKLSGVRLEAKGRLTRRYAAARSIYQVK
jgi:hypothetical protein